MRICVRASRWGRSATISTERMPMSQRTSQLFDESPLFLTDAGMETALIFHQGIDLPAFATFPLLEHEVGRDALRTYYAPFLELARSRGTGFVLGGGTWRANADWGAELGYDAGALAAANRRAVAFVDELRAGAPAEQGPVLLEAPIGPRADAYAPSSVMRSDEAQRYHSAQLETLSDTAADLVTAMTISYADEAVGMVRAARAAGLPIAVSFTVETDGRLPSGQTLRGAIEQVDAETDGAPVHYMINCSHPMHLEGALVDDGPWRRRIRGLRANASMLSHAELDEAEDLDDGDPADLAERYVALRAQLPALAILGGCCGTDIRHVTSICDAWLAAS
jgi:S-methylmethionine-dependent homocysteine/selenocysteine methylase